MSVEPESAFQPARVASLWRALRARCPVCGTKAISRHPAQVEPTCPQCGLELERQVGSYVGGVGLNTIVTFALIMIAILGGLLVTRGENGALPLLLPALTVAVLFPVLFYARSRLLWIALELFYWPLKPDEIADWSDQLGGRAG